MTVKKTVITGFDLLTAYGDGLNKCWDGMLAAKPAVSGIKRFPTENFISGQAALVPGLRYHDGESLALQMLKRLQSDIPEDACLFLATTVGEIDLLEEMVLSGGNDGGAAHQLAFLEKCLKLWNLKSGRLVSAACASATLALARAAAMIESGEIPCALVAAVDGVSEFVFSGFSALGAMSPEAAMPFDRDRSGLTVGEAAGIAVLMSADEAEKRGLPVRARLTGWGNTCDARHMTKPDESGFYLAEAIRKALRKATANPDDIGAIMAHGTGTLYNDEMEIAALDTVFSKSGKPMFSSKFGTGHTLGAAGIIQAGLALKILETRQVPPQGNLRNPMPGAEKFLSPEVRPPARGRILSINAGFGGINAALVIENRTTGL
ncbi:MAG: beta-ketoacyl synthase N-terminal-like domain-containing protein [Victivallaceae bacterium]|nr:beta-ketoacyl synthase N-terminal-like domain-containing protein [Victivallaceae bacterium]